MEEEILLNAGEKGIQNATAIIDNILKEQYHLEIDEAFSRLHQEEDYNKKDYTRVAFDTLESANNFYSFASEQGVPVVKTDNKYYGQYFVEIPTEFCLDNNDNKENSMSFNNTNENKTEQKNDDINSNMGYENSNNFFAVNNECNKEYPINQEEVLETYQNNNEINQSNQSDISFVDTTSNIDTTNDTNIDNNNFNDNSFNESDIQNTNNENNINEFNDYYEDNNTYTNADVSVDSKVDNTRVNTEEILNEIIGDSNEINQNDNSNTVKVDDNNVNNANNLNNVYNVNNINDNTTVDDNVNDANDININDSNVSDINIDDNNVYNVNTSEYIIKEEVVILDIEKDNNENNNQDNNTNNNQSSRDSYREYDNQDNNENNNQDNNTNNNTSSSTSKKWITAEEIILAFEKATNEKVEEVNKIEKDRTVQAVDKQQSVKVFTRHMDSFGSLFDKLCKVDNKFVTPYKSLCNEEIFTYENKNDTLHYNTGKVKKVTILKNNIVVKDGKIVKEDEEILSAFNQHKERIREADVILNEGKPERHGFIRDKEGEIRYKNSELIKNRVYRQSYRSIENRSYSPRNAKSLNKYRNEIGLEAIALSLEGDINIVFDDKERALITKIRENKDSINEINRKNLEEIFKKASFSTYFDRINTISALEDFERSVKKGKINLTNEEKKTLKSMLTYRRGIRLQPEEMAMFTNTTKTINAIKNDLGIDFVKIATKNSGITRADLLKITNNFLDKANAKGYNFITAFGKLDTKSLKKLSRADLKRIGVSKETLNVILELNDKDMGKKQSSGLFIKIIDKLLPEDEELQQVINDFRTIVQIPQHIKSVYTSIHQVSESIRAGYNKHKAKKEGVSETKANVKKKDTKKKKKKKEPEKNKAELRKQNLERTKKFKDKQEKKLEKITKSENGFISKFMNKFNNIKRKIADNPLSKLVAKIKIKLIAIAVKVVSFAMLIGATLMGGIILIAVAVTIIQSFLNLPMKLIDEILKPTTYKETVCYQLYECLYDSEKQWQDMVSNKDFPYKNKEQIKYGMQYSSYQDYLTFFNKELIIDPNKNYDFDNPDLDDTDLYINPYYELMAKDPTIDIDISYMTKVNNFDGKFNAEFGSNFGKYSQVKVGTTSSGSSQYIPAENGHTSNIKDIIAMCDVMYDFSTDDSSDGELTGILGQSPEQNDFHTIVDKICSGIKWIWGNIKAIFTDDEFQSIGDLEAEWNKADSKSYKTMLNYAKMLFETSHQNEYELKVEYYPIQKNVTLNASGKEVTLTKWDISQSDASQLGISIDPMTNKFPIYYINNRIVPCVMTTDGRKIPLDNNSYIKFKINMAENLVKGQNPSLWEGMGENKETWNKIKRHSDWKEEKKTTELDETTGGSALGSDKDENKAKEEAKKNLIKATEIYLEIHKKTYKDSYKLSADHNEFVYTTYKFDEGVYLNKITYEVTKIVKKDEEDKEETFYRVLARYPEKMVEEIVYTYNRDTDKKYEFEYDGGHVCVNSIGSTYSITNEQFSLVNSYDNKKQEPHAKDFDIKSAYDGGIKGKYNGFKELNGKYLLDISTPTSATNSGLSKAPEYDAQGSAITSKYGLNLNIDTSSGEMTTGFQYVGGNQENAKYLFAGMFRDIFDADCSILKGNNIFPWKDGDYRKYKGWDEDNMSIACLKTSMDWYDTYEFDIPYELAMSNSKDLEAPLKDKVSSSKKKKAMESDDTIFSPCVTTKKDIKGIIEALKSTYGSRFTKSREEVVEQILNFIGRGHRTTDYNNAYKSSDFLDVRKLHVIDDYEKIKNPSLYPDQFVCNTGTSELGFVNYLTKYFNKRSIQSRVPQRYDSLDNLLPADILSHKGENYKQVELPETEKDIKKNISLIISALNEYSKDTYVVYLGTLKEDYTMQDGRVLKAGQPLTVDMGLKGYYRVGSLRLESETANSWLDYINNPFANYYWITNPTTNNCKVYRWE